MASGLAARATADAGPRRLVIVGNSVSMPPQPGVAAYPERLAQILGGCWRVTTIIRSGATVEEMEDEVIAALEEQPNALVLQVGINECAPRPLAPAGRARLATLQPVWFRDRFIGAIHRWRPQIIRLRPLAQFTTLDRFGACVGRIARAARGARTAMLILPITEVTEAAERRTPFTRPRGRALQRRAAGRCGPASWRWMRQPCSTR